MQIESILFNTDTTKTENTALNLRYSYSVPMLYPEYNIMRGNNAYVCYISDNVNNDLEIKVKLSGIPESLNNKWIFIKAEEADNTNCIFGDSDEKKIGIVESNIQGGEFKIKFSQNNISRIHIGKFNVVLNWKFRIESFNDWVDIGSTKHNIFIIPHNPLTNLWNNNDISALNTPWVETLDYICSYFSTTSADLTDGEIAKKIAEFINSGYFIYQGDTSYSSFSNDHKKTVFQPVKFTNDILFATSNNRLKVNCNDCAAINAFLLSIVGIHTNILYLSDSFDFNEGFDCNEIQSIGNDKWALPFKDSAKFRYHAVCSPNNSEGIDLITDSCLKLDSGAGPWTPYVPETDIKKAVVPLEMQFADPTTDISHNIPNPAAPYVNQFYRERLCSNPLGINSCKIVAKSSILEFDMNGYSPLFLCLNEKNITYSKLLKNCINNNSKYNKIKLSHNYQLDEIYKKRKYISTDEKSFTDYIYADNNSEPLFKISVYECDCYNKAVMLLDNYICTSSFFCCETDKLSNLVDISLTNSGEDFVCFIKSNYLIIIDKEENCQIDIFDTAKNIIDQMTTE